MHGCTQQHNLMLGLSHASMQFVFHYTGHLELENQLFSSSLLQLWLTGAHRLFSEHHEEDEYVRLVDGRKY